MAGNDFVDVQLTAAGAKLAGDHALRISNGRRTFAFFAGKPLRVERSYEWTHVLAKHFTPDGAVLFELVPEPTAPATAQPSEETH